jgi:hypothetical protein
MENKWSICYEAIAFTDTLNKVQLLYLIWEFVMFVIIFITSYRPSTFWFQYHLLQFVTMRKWVTAAGTSTESRRFFTVRRHLAIHKNAWSEYHSISLRDLFNDVSEITIYSPEVTKLTWLEKLPHHIWQMTWLASCAWHGNPAWSISKSLETTAWPSWNQKGRGT